MDFRTIEIIAGHVSGFMGLRCGSMAANCLVDTGQVFVIFEEGQQLCSFSLLLTIPEMTEEFLRCAC